METKQTYSIEELGQRVRQRDPTAFVNFSDKEIGQRILQRKPELSNLIKQETQPQQKQNTNIQAQDPFKTIEDQGGFQSGFSKVLGAGSNLLVGGIKGAAQTANDLSKRSPFTKVVEQQQSRQTGKTLQQIQEENKAKTDALLQRNSVAQNVGYGAEKIGEFFVPGALGLKGAAGANAIRYLATAEKVGPLLSKVLPRFGSMATEALGSQIVSASQEGGVNKNNFINSLTQGAFSQLGKVPNTILGLTQGARGASDIAQGNTAQGITELGMGALALKGAKNQKGLFLNKPVVTGSKQIPIPKDYEGKITIPEAKGMAHQKFGLSIFDNQVKPSGSDYSHGYDVNNAQKYDLIRPSIQESAQATNERIASYGKALQDVKDKYGDPRVIDLNAALAATKKKLMGSGKDFNQGSYDAAAKKLIAEMNKFDPTWRTTKSEFTTGWKAKAAAGDLASFERDPLKAGETTPKEKFFNEFYTQLKNQLEENAPPQYKDINKALTDLFPIQKALNRRVPVDVRNNKLSLGDLITGTAALAHPSTIPIFAAMKASKSLPFARFLSNLGPKEQPFIPGAVPDLPQYPQLEANLRNPPQYPRIKDGGIRVAPKAEGPQLTQDQIKARLWQSGTLNLQNTGPSPRFNLPSKASLPGQINLPSPGVLSGQEILRNIINTKAKEVPTKMRFKKK